MKPIEDVREISRIGYGFMASKALFSALNFNIFGLLSEQPKLLAELSKDTGLAENRLKTLLVACSSLGLIGFDGDRYSNAPASQEYLVPTSPNYYGDYFRYQVDRQIFPSFCSFDLAMQGQQLDNFYDSLDSPEEAEHFSKAQHSGSRGPAHLLAKNEDLTGIELLLDVAGGSGAFSIKLCQKYDGLSATIIDFPAVIEVAKKIVAEEKLADRFNYVPGDASEVEWPESQDVVLMSYLLYCVAEDDIPNLMKKAYGALKPNGKILIHDFMVEETGLGPTSAALWMMHGVLSNPEAALLTPKLISEYLFAAGFEGIENYQLIPGITRVTRALKRT